MDLKKFLEAFFHEVNCLSEKGYGILIYLAKQDAERVENAATTKTGSICYQKVCYSSKLLPKTFHAELGFNRTGATFSMNKLKVILTLDGRFTLVCSSKEKIKLFLKKMNLKKSYISKKGNRFYCTVKTDKSFGEILYMMNEVRI